MIEKEKVQANLNIVELNLRSFFLAMNDHWTSEDYDLDKKLSDDIRKAKAVYKATYGEEPMYEYCKNHDDVIDLKKKLKDYLSKFNEEGDHNV